MAQEDAEQNHLLVVGDDDHNSRLDRFIVSKLDGLSRGRVQGLIRSGCVIGDSGALTDVGQRVKAGQEFRVRVPAPEPATLVPERIALDIVFEDQHLLVINKPSGLVVHPAPGHAGGTLVNALLAHCGEDLSGIGGVRRPGIVHRLDKDTSGLLVVAKSDRAHTGLSEQFAMHGRDGRLQRSYLGVVWGVPSRSKGTIDLPLGRHAGNRLKISVDRSGNGREARTHYHVQQAFKSADGRELAALCAMQLETGRTHQIRVHMAYIGHPVVGDALYGAGFAASARRLSPAGQSVLQHLGRQALHAAVLGFVHPITGDEMTFDCPMPDDMAALVARLAQEGD